MFERILSKIIPKEDKAKIGTAILPYANYYGNEEEKKAEAFIEFLSVFNLWNKITFNNFDLF